MDASILEQFSKLGEKLATIVKQRRYVVLSSVMHHPLESGFTLFFMHFHQNSEVLSCCIQNNNKVFFAVHTITLSNSTAVNFPWIHVFVDRDLFAFKYFHSFVEYPMDYHLLRSFTLAILVPPHDKTLEIPQRVRKYPPGRARN